MDERYIPVTSVTSGDGREVRTDIFCLPVQIVNVCFVGNPDEKKGWVLIDAGMPKSADAILSAAEKRFGSDNRPKAIILTHGHFDHVGALVDLVEHWDVPVYAHEREMPYLTGQKRYPQPDATVEGGLVAKMSPLFPNDPVDLESRVKKLPDDGSVPEMPEWQWMHTPGHAPGHVSFFRDEDRSLIAGDAFVTVKQESLFKVITQEKEISGPPRYLTTDWEAARQSVEKLAALQPAAAVTGHGLPAHGKWLTNNLDKLIREFDSIAVPDYGKYVDQGV